jgi:hypothetical protein
VRLRLPAACAALCAGITLDAGTTLVFLRAGLEEGNPLLHALARALFHGSLPWAVVSTHVIGIAAAIAICAAVESGRAKASASLAGAFMGTAAAIFLGAAAWNAAALAALR